MTSCASRDLAVQPMAAVPGVSIDLTVVDIMEGIAPCPHLHEYAWRVSESQCDLKFSDVATHLKQTLSFWCLRAVIAGDINKVTQSRRHDAQPSAAQQSSKHCSFVAQQSYPNSGLERAHSTSPRRRSMHRSGAVEKVPRSELHGKLKTGGSNK